MICARFVGKVLKQQADVSRHYSQILRFWSLPCRQMSLRRPKEKSKLSSAVARANELRRSNGTHPHATSAPPESARTRGIRSSRLSWPFSRHYHAAALASPLRPHVASRLRWRFEKKISCALSLELTRPSLQFQTTVTLGHQQITSDSPIQ
jgi:hypothetical protein